MNDLSPSAGVDVGSLWLDLGFHPFAKPIRAPNRIHEAYGSARCGNGGIPMSRPLLLPIRMRGSCGLCSPATQLTSPRCR